MIVHKPLTANLPIPSVSAGQHSASGMSPDAAHPDTEAVTVKADGTGAGIDRSRPLSIPCQECEGEGGWYHYGAGSYDPDSAIRRWVECDECGGAGEFEQEEDDENE